MNLGLVTFGFSVPQTGTTTNWVDEKEFENERHCKPPTAIFPFSNNKQHSFTLFTMFLWRAAAQFNQRHES